MNIIKHKLYVSQVQSFIYEHMIIIYLYDYLINDWFIITIINIIDYFYDFYCLYT